MKITQFFNTHPVFRFSEFKSFMGERKPGCSVNNCYTTLQNYTRKGDIVHVRKGLYVVTSKAVNATPNNPFLLVGKATDDAILAYHTALESHGFAYTHFNEHSYLTTKRTTSFNFEHQHYRAIPIQKKLEKIGIEEKLIFGIAVRQTTLERTIVDVLDKPNLSGGWEEITRSLELVNNFKPELCLDYALKLNRSSIIAKLGYAFENFYSHLKISDDILDELRKHIPKKPLLYFSQPHYR